MALLGDLDIDVRDTSWNTALDDAPALAAQTFRAVLQTSPLADPRPCEISLVLTGDDDIATLNSDYRDRDRATNVLSFPSQDFTNPEELVAEPGPLLLGDIVLGFGTCEREAADQGKAFDTHVTHLLVHGLLHLLGHDHMSDEDADTMEAREIDILARLGIANPYD